MNIIYLIHSLLDNNILNILCLNLSKFPIPKYFHRNLLFSIFY